MPDRQLSKIEENDLQDLIDQIRREKVVLFIGSGVSAEAGLPTAWEIGLELARESGYQGGDPTNLPDVTQHYERRFGRQRLVDKLNNMFQGRAAATDVTSYDLIAELGVFPQIVTTNWDELLKVAFESKGKSLNIIKSNANIPTLHQGLYALLKLHGDFTLSSDEMVITEKDYIGTYKPATETGGMFGLLGTWLQTRTVLFVGYSLRDRNFRLLFNLVNAKVGSAPVRHYAVMREVEDYERGAWERDNVRIIRMTAREFFGTLFIELKGFANRDLEIEYICNQAKLPFVEVHGAVGCGKTELLRQARKLYRLKEPPWSSSLISMVGMDEFGVISQLSSEILGWTIEHDRLREEVGEDVERAARQEERIPTTVEMDLAAAARGADRLADAFRSRQLALFFDDMERAQPSAINWLEKVFLRKLWDRHYEPHARVRVVFAGRTLTRWQTWFIKQRRFGLTLVPLDEVAVTEMLRSAVALTIKAPLSRQTNDQMVKRILWLSGGHPAAIRNLLQHLAERQFAVYMGDLSGGAPDYFEQQRRGLFMAHVYPVIEPVLRGLSDETQEQVRSLSIYRRFNVAMLEEVLQVEHPGITKSSGEILKELKGAYLMQEPRVNPLDSLDPMVRHILAQWLEIEKPVRYIRLHILAVAQFDRWIDEMRGGRFDSEYWRTYITESLFHRATLVRLAKESADRLGRVFRDCIKDIAELAGSGEAGAAILKQLRPLLENDRELLTTVVAALREEGFNELLETVDEQIRLLTEVG